MAKMDWVYGAMGLVILGIIMFITLGVIGFAGSGIYLFIKLILGG